jgi:GTP-binding protein
MAESQPEVTRATRNAAVAKLRRAEYLGSAHSDDQLPPPGAPEIAFAGRSNAGKSSAINTITGRTRLAFTSKTPGRTQLINLFACGSDLILVDLPGYGFAGVPKAVRAHWEELVGGYLRTRESLAGVVIMMDSRHPLTPLDLELLDWLAPAATPVHVLLTKSDKLSRNDSTALLRKVRAELHLRNPGTSVQLFSSLKRTGIDEAALAIEAFASRKKQAIKNPG